MLEQRLNEWVQKVMAVHDGGGMVNTYAMIVDIDKIIADEFDHEPVFIENT